MSKFVLLDITVIVFLSFTTGIWFHNLVYVPTFNIDTVFSVSALGVRPKDCLVTLDYTSREGNENPSFLVKRQISLIKQSSSCKEFSVGQLFKWKELK